MLLQRNSLLVLIGGGLSCVVAKVMWVGGVVVLFCRFDVLIFFLFLLILIYRLAN